MLSLEGKIKIPALAAPKISSKPLSKYKGWAATSALSWLAIAAYFASPYYKHLLRPETKTTLVVLAAAYTVFGFIVYLLLPANKLPKSKGLIIVRTAARYVVQAKSYLARFPLDPTLALPKVTFEEKTAMLFFLVKLFFVPLMINYLFINYSYLTYYLPNYPSASEIFTISGFNQFVFPILLSVFFFIDVAIYCFGYIFESRFLGNTVRSVEPTVLGWVVALVCYVPFSNILHNYVSWHADEYMSSARVYSSFTLHVLVLVLFAVNMLASMALGAKASNLTNRGIVGRGPYAWVRHPAYASKNIAWWLTLIPVFSLAAVVSMVIWSFVYYLRSITEERHLLRDPDYQEYVKKVRYRFVPGVW